MHFPGDGPSVSISRAQSGIQALEGLLLRYTALVPQPHRQTPLLLERMARSSAGSTAQVTQRVHAASELTPHLLASPSWGAGSAATPSAAAEALTGALSCGALTGRSHAADGWSGGSGSSPAQAPGAFQLGRPLATAHRRQGARGAAANHAYSLRACGHGRGLSGHTFKGEQRKAALVFQPLVGCRGDAPARCRFVRATRHQTTCANLL